MNRAIPSALFFVSVTGAVWAVYVILLALIAGTDFARHTTILIQIGPLFPLIIARFVSRHFARHVQRMMTGAERVTLAVCATLGITVMAHITETAIVFPFLAQSEGVSFGHMLLQPPFSRYTVSTAFGFSFMTLAMLAAGFTTLVSIPAQVMLAVRKQS